MKEKIKKIKKVRGREFNKKEFFEKKTKHSLQTFKAKINVCHFK